MSEVMDFKITRLWDGTKDFSKDADVLVTLSGNKFVLTYVQELLQENIIIVNKLSIHHI